MLEAEAKRELAPAHDEIRIDFAYFHSAVTFWRTQLAAYIAKSEYFPEGFILKTPPLAKFGVERAVNNVMTGAIPIPTVQYPSYEEAEPEDEAGGPRSKSAQARRLEQAFYGILSHIARTKGQNPLRDMMTKLFAVGIGILAYPMDRHTYPDPPFGVDGKGNPRLGRNTPANREKLRQWKMQRERGLPWSVRSVNPLNCYFDPFNDPPEWVIEERKVNGRVLAAQYGKEAEFGHREQSWTGTLKEFCSPEYYGVFLDNKPLLDGKDGADLEGFAPNPVGKLWYEFAWAGMGDEQEHAEMVYRMQGLIRPNRPAVDMLITAINVLEAIRRVNAFPTIGFEPMNPNGRAEDMSTKEIEDFRVTNSTWVHKVWKQHLLELPQVPEALMRDFVEGEKLFEMGFGPDVLSGKWRDETASGQLVRLEQARAPLLPGKASGEQAVANMLTNMALQTRDQIGERMERWAKIQGRNMRVRLDPKDIHDDMMVEVDFTPPTQQERTARYQLLEGKYKAGAISLRRFVAQDDSQIVDIEDEIAEIMADAVMKDPKFVESIMQQAMPQPISPQPEPEPSQGELLGNMVGDSTMLQQGGAPPMTQPNGIPGVVPNPTQMQPVPPTAPPVGMAASLL